MNADKKAQQSLNDLVFWYAICLAIVFISVGVLYGTGVIGNYERQSLIGNNEITAAAVAVPANEPVANNTDGNATMNPTE
jgi:hypothetical protein